MLEPSRHRVFISFHHANDQSYKDRFERNFEVDAISGSVRTGDFSEGLSTEHIRQQIRDRYLRETSVTVVLVGTATWQRKHVDWEIAASIRSTAYNPRSGILALLLPSYTRTLRGFERFNRYTLPPRIADNLDNDFAVIERWTDDPKRVRSLIHDAYLRKGRITPDNSRPMFGKNRSGDRWYP